MFTSPYFSPVVIAGRNLPPEELSRSGCLEHTVRNSRCLPLGVQSFQGIPFDCGDRFIYVRDGSLQLTFPPLRARYLVFLHASETQPQAAGEDGIVRNFRGPAPLMEHICDYAVRYADGSEVTVPIRSRMEINDMRTPWGQGPFLTVPHIRDKAIPTATDNFFAGLPGAPWGGSQTRVYDGWSELTQWLFAYENPYPDKPVIGMEIRKKDGNVFLFGIAAGDVASHPLRYGRRQKALLSLTGDPKDALNLVDIDLGHIISVTPQQVYENISWENSSAEDMPSVSEGKYIVEFDAHEDAILYAGEERAPIPFKDIRRNAGIFINPAERPVTLKVLDENNKPVPAKVHAHGAAGEYLPPRNRHRIPNPHWFEDYGADHTRGGHWSCYIDGTAEYWLPSGEVFFEVTK
ncbi:MAG: hypothetical protein FWC55_08710, partial [Firmicutes bacterium]|nr:hypothetical protein [Bacillota bacterium]